MDASIFQTLSDSWPRDVQAAILVASFPGSPHFPLTTRIMFSIVCCIQQLRYQLVHVVYIHALKVYSGTPLMWIPWDLGGCFPFHVCSHGFSHNWTKPPKINQALLTTEMNDTKRKKNSCFVLFKFFSVSIMHGLAMHLEVVAATPVLQLAWAIPMLNHNTGFLVQQSHVIRDSNYIVV